MLSPSFAPTSSPSGRGSAPRSESPDPLFILRLSSSPFLDHYSRPLFTTLFSFFRDPQPGELLFRKQLDDTSKRSIVAGRGEDALRSLSLGLASTEERVRHIESVAGVFRNEWLDRGDRKHLGTSFHAGSGRSDDLVRDIGRSGAQFGHPVAVASGRLPVHLERNEDKQRIRFDFYLPVYHVDYPVEYREQLQRLRFSSPLRSGVIAGFRGSLPMTERTGVRNGETGQNPLPARMRAGQFFGNLKTCFC